MRGITTISVSGWRALTLGLCIVYGGLTLTATSVIAKPPPKVPYKSKVPPPDNTDVNEAQTVNQQNVDNTALNALHNQRIVRARSAMSNPRGYVDEVETYAVGIGKGKAKMKTVVTETTEPNRWEIFGVGDFGYFAQDNVRSETHTWLGSVGAEYYVSPIMNVGLAYSYGTGETELDNSLDNTDVEGHLASIFATFFWEGGFVDVLYMYGHYDNEIERDTLTPAGVAIGTTDSESHTFSLNAGHNFEIGGLVTGPTFGFTYTAGSIDAYEEDGGGIASLSYEERDFRSAVTELGWHVSKTFDIAPGLLTLQGSASWDHQLESDSDNVRASFTGLPGAPGLDQAVADTAGDDWVSLGAAAILELDEGVTITVDYQAQVLRDNAEAHYAGIKLSADF